MTLKLCSRRGVAVSQQAGREAAVTPALSRRANRCPLSDNSGHSAAQAACPLCASGTPEDFCCLSGGYESAVSILRRHRWGRLYIRQAPSRGSGEYRSGGGLIIGELANYQPVMAAKGQVPLDEPASDTLEELETASLRFSGLATMPLTASEVKRPREM